MATRPLPEEAAAQSALERWHRQLELNRWHRQLERKRLTHGPWFLEIYPPAEAGAPSTEIEFGRRVELADPSANGDWSLVVYRRCANTYRPMVWRAARADLLHPGREDGALLAKAGVQYVIVRRSPAPPFEAELRDLPLAAGELVGSLLDYNEQWPAGRVASTLRDSPFDYDERYALLLDNKRPPSDAKVREAIGRIRAQLDSIEAGLAAIQK